MKKAKKSLTMSLLLTLAISMGPVSRLQAYCLVNNSDIDRIVVIVFKNDNDLKNYLTATGWTDKVANTLIAISHVGGKAIFKYGAGINIGPMLDWFGDSLKYTNIHYWLGQLAKKIELYKYSLKNHTIKKGKKACWAWAEITQKIKDPMQKTLTFLVINPKNKENPIVFVGELNFACGLTLEDEGKVNLYYPFIDSNGNIHLLTMPEGKARGYVVPEGILPAPEQPRSEE